MLGGKARTRPSKHGATPGHNIFFTRTPALFSVRSELHDVTLPFGSILLHIRINLLSDRNFGHLKHRHHGAKGVSLGALDGQRSDVFGTG